jgi:hypothetical protein
MVMMVMMVMIRSGFGARRERAKHNRCSLEGTHLLQILNRGRSRQFDQNSRFDAGRVLAQRRD